MKKEQLPRYAIALAVLVVGLAVAGVPLASLLFVPLVLACPLMMIFMMRGMGGSPNQDSDHKLQHDGHEIAPDTRLAQLEREVAELRAAEDRAPSGR